MPFLFSVTGEKILETFALMNRPVLSPYLCLGDDREPSTESATHVVLPQVLIQERQYSHPLRPLLDSYVHHLDTNENYTRLALKNTTILHAIHPPRIFMGRAIAILLQG